MKSISMFVVLVLSAPALAGIDDPAFKSNRISTDEFQTLLHVVRESGNQELLTRSSKKLGVNSDVDLAQIVRICPKFKDTSTLGHFMPLGSTLLLSRKSNETKLVFEEQNSYFKSQVAAAVPNGVEVIVKPGHFAINFEQFPVICLKEGQTLGESAVVLVHELTHWVGYALNEKIDIFTYPTHREYVKNMIERKGGEIDAVKAENKALAQLKKKYPSSKFRGTENEGMNSDQVIMAYQKFYENQFSDVLVNQLNNLLSELNFSFRVTDELDRARRNVSAEDKTYVTAISIFQTDLSTRLHSLKTEYSGYVK